MNFEEHTAKPLLRAAGIATPDGALARTPDEAETAARRIGPCVVKAQVPTGKRGKAGGIKLAADAAGAKAAAGSILGMTIGEHRVAAVLVEAQVPIAREMYAAVRLPVDIRKGLDSVALRGALPKVAGLAADALAELLGRLYAAYATSDAELMEINPLVLTADGRLIALDCKYTMDDSAIPRHAELAKSGTPDKLTPLEERGKSLGLKFIELDGSVGVLANGAGLTMTTMDAVRHFGGSPANFMEIGGESYTKAKPALELVLSNSRVKCLLVNFCGAFARTDVMAEGVINAWLDLKPAIPIFFTIHGTGEDEAIVMVKDRLGIEPYDLMDDAVKAAVAAAQGART